MRAIRRIPVEKRTSYPSKHEMGDVIIRVIGIGHRDGVGERIQKHDRSLLREYYRLRPDGHGTTLKLLKFLYDIVMGYESNT